MDLFEIGVKLTGPDGEVAVPRMPMTMNTAKRLSSGEQIPVRYLASEPKHVLQADEETESPWGTLISGSIALALGLYAYRLLKREMGQRS